MNNTKATMLGIQHLLAMYAGAILVPLIIGGALGFDSAQMTYLVAIDIFMCGLATLIQVWRGKAIGIIIIMKKMGNIYFMVMVYTH